MESAEIILDAIYRAYGTDSGILFGIRDKGAVKAIIDFALNYSPSPVIQKEEIQKFCKDKSRGKNDICKYPIGTCEYCQPF